MRNIPVWTALYIDPETEDGITRWRMTHDWWPSREITAEEALKELLPNRYNQPLWAFALAKLSNCSWYDLHYPEGIERKAPPKKRNLGPHFWVPGDSEFKLP